MNYSSTTTTTMATANTYSQRVAKMNGIANYNKADLKRKHFSRGKGKRPFKRFKKTPKYIKDNVENQAAREKDIFDFTDDEDDDFNETHLDISNLTIQLQDNSDKKQQDLVALTQDSVCPLFASEDDYDDAKVLDGLAELKYSQFRLNQHETVKRILFGRSTLFISPTGSGKSLCYQLPALLYWRFRRYITIVVSPLISLMEDQMSTFPSCLKAVSLHSGHNPAQRRKSLDQLIEGEAQVVFLSPEAIVGGVLELDDLRNLPPIGFVCIDEAHCLSEWSHNFRPAYLQFFKILNEQMNIKTFLGLTATATKATSFAICRNLIINPETDVIGTTTIPENLILSVSYETNKEKALIDLLKTPSVRILPSIIVYCNRREETENLATRIRTAMQNYSTLIEVPKKVKRDSSKNDSIKSNDSDQDAEKQHMKLTWNAEAYHAGLSMDTRRRIQRQFIKGEIRVVCATVAFGMGINKLNVRAIIHYDMPGSVENYVQEIGRAGRDGKPAQCHMFLKADKSDLFYQQRHIYANTTERKHLGKLINLLFAPCRCAELCSKKSEEEALDKLNQKDVHEIVSYHTNQDADVEESSSQSSTESTNENIYENEPKSHKQKSVVRKHRICEGHEVAFGIEQASENLNLEPERIITLICQLQQAYPQLKIKQFAPTKSKCHLFCYKGAKQMEELAKNSPPVFMALLLHRQEHLKAYGTKCETPSEFEFDVIKIASRLGKPSSEVIRKLKQSEWQLVEKTGRFRRSQVKVRFEGNDFHLNAVGDLNKKETDELLTFLYDFERLYENVERQKLEKTFNTFFKNSISLDNMTNKSVRFASSSQLKKALNSYFNPSLDGQSTINDSSNQQKTAALDESKKPSEAKIEAIRKDTRNFISAHGEQEFTARIIAKIFQGISTPGYPAKIWGSSRMWWRLHLDVDFLQLREIIQEQLAKLHVI